MLDLDFQVLENLALFNMTVQAFEFFMYELLVYHEKFPDMLESAIN